MGRRAGDLYRRSYYRSKLVIEVQDKGYVRLCETLGSDLSVVNAARVSYDKESSELGPKDKGLLNFLAKNGHTSPFRHAAITFEVYAPLMVARQWWKYVVGGQHQDSMLAWNESSRRYITEEPEFHIPEPDQWRSAPENLKQGSGPPLKVGRGIKLNAMLKKYIDEGEALYNNAMESGVAPEQARLFLPAYGMYVRWRWTSSLQGVFHFLDQRLEHDAQYEIVEYAQAVHVLVAQAFPATSAAWFDAHKS